MARCPFQRQTSQSTVLARLLGMVPAGCRGPVIQSQGAGQRLAPSVRQSAAQLWAALAGWGSLSFGLKQPTRGANVKCPLSYMPRARHPLHPVCGSGSAASCCVLQSAGCVTE